MSHSQSLVSTSQPSAQKYTKLRYHSQKQQEPTCKATVTPHQDSGRGVQNILHNNPAAIHGNLCGHLAVHFIPSTCMNSTLPLSAVTSPQISGGHLRGSAVESIRSSPVGAQGKAPGDCVATRGTQDGDFTLASISSVPRATISCAKFLQT